MIRIVRTAALAVAAAALATSAPADDKKGEVLKTVTEATYEFDKDKKKLTVHATGQVPTGGWKDAKLTPRATKEAPKDGIYEYDLTAVRPDGIVTQVISQVKASHAWENPPADIKGVKIYGTGAGAKTVKFGK
ncbi:MAG: hypothetical protein ACKODX_02700 [Gemmata sp.]|jgi:hypothetical protein